MKAIKENWIWGNYACNKTVRTHRRNGFTNYTSSFKEREYKNSDQQILDDGSIKTNVNVDVAAELRLKGLLEQLQVNVLKGNSETLEKIPDQMELE